MTAACQNCQGRAQLFLCGICQTQLRTMLTDLPWWVDRLAEAAVGHAKLGDGGRGGANGARLKGDDEVLPKCTCGHPEHELRDQCGATIPGAVTVIELVEPDADGNTSREIRAPDRTCVCREYMPCVKQAKIRAQFLAAGRVNARASDLLAEVQNTLTTWVRHLCEQRGLPLSAVRAVAPSFIGPLPDGSVRCRHTSAAGLAAVWLAEHVSAIAADEGAGQTFEDIHRLIVSNHHDSQIVKRINRPIPPRFIGPCVTDPAPDDVLDARREADDYETRCNHALTADRKAAQITCPACKQTYEVEQLITQLYDESRDMLVTVRDLVDWVLPKLDEPVPQRTLEQWIKRGELAVRGHSAYGAQMVRLGDVREVRAKRPRHAKRAG